MIFLHFGKTEVGFSFNNLKVPIWRRQQLSVATGYYTL